MNVHINRKRLVEEFLELVKIPSLSKREGQLARVLKSKLEQLGFKVTIDQAGDIIQGETGNLIGYLGPYPPERTNQGLTLLLSAHMDTVVPGEGIVPIVEEGIIRSSGDTILGADDKSGIAAILEAIRAVKENKLNHSSLIVVFSVAEEVGLLGAINLDRTKVKADIGVVLDSSGPVGRIITRGPMQSNIKAVISGKAAHAGIAPEEGVSAIQIAAEAVRRMKLGRIDSETTANIGTINGGKATNIVPDEVLIEGEARSLSEEKLAYQNESMRKAFLEAADELGGKCDVQITTAFPSINIKSDDYVIDIIKRAADRAGVKGELTSTGGGSDANIYNGYGIPTVNLATGMERVHTKEESIQVSEMVNLTSILVEIVKNCAEQV